MAEPKRDIELISTHDLLNELAGRFDAAVFAAARNDGRQEHRFKFHCRGSLCSCMAVAVHALHRLNLIFAATAFETEPGEDR